MVNMVTSILSTLLFIFMGILLQRLRRSNRLRAKMEKFLPTAKTKQSKPWGIKKKKKKKESSNIPTNLPYPQVDPGYQQKCEIMKKNRMSGFYPSYPTASYPSSNYPMPWTTQITTSNEREIVPR